MHASFRTCLPLALLALAACSSKPGQPAGAASPGKPAADSPAVKANAEYARLKAQGPDATAREFTRIEYPATRNLMKAGGLDTALGGEAKADVALQVLHALYEHKARALAAELPTLFDLRSGGGGGDGSGGGGDAGWGGIAASSIAGGLQNAMGEQAWERAQDEGQSSGSHTETTANGSSTVDWTQDGYTTTTTFEGHLPEGLKGKVTTKVKAVACPDAQGKVEVEFESTSDLSAGGGNAQTKVSSKLIEHLNDDANLVDDEMDSDVHVEQTTGAGNHVDVSDVLSTSRGEMGSTVNGRNHGASDEDVQLAQGLAKVGRMAAMGALDAAKKAWESGKCVQLDVRSDPAKRSGAKPNTAYTLFAEPRAKSDGAPTRGTVKATLSGEHMLNPRDRKVPADAQFDYQNPEKKDQSATIDFEARSRRGVGKASLQFDTKRGGYRIDISGAGTNAGGGACHVEPITTCDITKPFVGEFCGGTLTHTPSGDKGGTFEMRVSGGGGSFTQSGSYALSGPEERMTATYASTRLCAQAGGRTICLPPRTLSATWTKVQDCGQ
jgi:hypothetical protein